MDINNLTVGQVKEIAGLAGCLGAPKAAVASSDSTIRIVVLQRGWIVVGKVTQTGDEIRVDTPSIIRVWGTSKGLGEIAEDGPTSKTVLDKCPTIRAHVLTVLMQISCYEKNWAKYVG